MHEALFYEKLEHDEVRCVLCPRMCHLKPGKTGNCKVRVNMDGRLITLVYNKVSAIGIDPVEKKPLYHFYPGRKILSIGEVGCNFHCSFCQNYQTSQCSAEDFSGFHEFDSEDIVNEAVKVVNNIGIAYTYNEPFTFYEFMLEIAIAAKSAGLKNVIVSNGYINPEPLQKILPYIDAFNIDLKAFDNDFYRRQTGGKLQPVLETLKIISDSGKHLEITNLVIPELNDDPVQFGAMVQWIGENAGSNVPLHLSRYFPQYKLNLPPTPEKKLKQLYNLAKSYLNHVYLGNVSDEQRSSTYCHNCGDLLIERNRYRTSIMQQGFKGVCQSCGASSGMVF
ncbi:MAG: AmmeMemoRadiSam system radical SAM enzyme [Prolixibacteraceae bacterium]|nr:AmmeMemoRadiSam system radical SAM enzyme [Prolixibacteraceae bacterium]